MSFYSALDNSGVPIDLNFAALRQATTLLSSVPDEEYPFKTFPRYVQDALRDSINLFKTHFVKIIDLENSLTKLNRHKANSTFPTSVISAAPGLRSYNVDKILPDDIRSMYSTTMETAVHTCRVTILNTFIDSNTKAIEFHRNACALHTLLAKCRDQILDEFLIMGKSVNDLPREKQLLVFRALCHLRHAIEAKDESIRYNNAKKLRERERYLQQSSAAMDISTDLTPAQMQQSLDRLVDQKVKKEIQKTIKTLNPVASGSSRSSRSRPPRSSRPPRGSSTKKSGSSRGPASSKSGKDRRPLVQGSASGRVNKGPTNQNRRLAPTPSPAHFPSSKGKRK